MGLDRGPDIIGRELELDALTAFVGSLGEGPGAMVLCGAPGVGKTTLWRAAAEAAANQGCRVLTARPSAAEAPLVFAGLRDLLEEVADEVLERLPPPQADALRIAMLLERPTEQEVPEAVVATSCLSALRLISLTRPLLVAIDDLQWLDVPTAAVLAFAWRRIRAQRVGLLVAYRDGAALPSPFGGLERAERVAVGPLDTDAIQELLERRLGLAFRGPTLRRLHAMAGGNPFFALELGPAFDRHRADVAAGAAPPVPDRLRDLIADRVERLPAVTRAALAAAAALARPTPALIARAGAVADSLSPAFAARVVELEGDRIRFTHPLLAAAAYEALDPLTRRALHERLATVVPDDDEAAHHLGLATIEPDAAVATVLERSADDAFRRGASTAAAERYEQALRVTPSSASGDRHRRMMRAARHRWTAGDFRAGRELLEQAVAEAPSPAARSKALVRLGWVCLYEGNQPRAAGLARAAVSEGGTELSTYAEGESCLTAALFMMGEDLEHAALGATRAADLGKRSGDRLRQNDGLILRGVVDSLRGVPGWEASLRAAEDQGEAAAGWRVHGWPSALRATAGLWTDDHVASIDTFRRLIAEAIERGDEVSVPELQAHLAVAEFLAGRWEAARTTAHDAMHAASRIGVRPYEAIALAVRARIVAATGDDHGARTDAATALDIIGRRGTVTARVHATSALALLDLADGRAEHAADRLRALRERLLAAGYREPAALGFAADEVEALTAMGRVDAASDLVAWLARRGRALGRASALAAAARGDGMLAAARGDHEAAIAGFQAALPLHDRAAMPFERARTLLHLGAAQRRAKRKLAARATLKAAGDAFDELGAFLWREQAAQELARISGRRPTGSGLTPTERRIVALVAEGMTNREVAATLYLSPKTVEAALRNVFRKLGVRSRTALTRHFLAGQTTGISSLPDDAPPT
jgi:DNA-binding CsgD family transcriptional regulator